MPRATFCRTCWRFRLRRRSGWATTPGLKSYRTEVFKQFPRTDIPDHFDSYSRFSALRRSAGQDWLHQRRQEDLVGHCGRIHTFPTLEFRICDIPTRVDDTIAIAALFQAIVAKLNTA